MVACGRIWVERWQQWRWDKGGSGVGVLVGDFVKVFDSSFIVFQMSA